MQCDQNHVVFSQSNVSTLKHVRRITGLVVIERVTAFQLDLFPSTRGASGAGPSINRFHPNPPPATQPNPAESLRSLGPVKGPDPNTARRISSDSL